MNRITVEAGVRSRLDLASRLATLGVSRSTLYRAFDSDWNGEVSIPVLDAVRRTFDVSLDDLVRA